MTTNPIQKLIDTGIQFTEMQRAQAEAVVRQLVEAGEVRRNEANQTIQALIAKGKETTAAIAEIVQHEVARQVGWMAERIDDLEDQLEALVSRFTGGEEPAATTPPPAPKPAAEPAPAKKAAAKKAPARKVAAKKAPAKKTAAKKTAAKRSVSR